jgi:GMP synthase-like glutamine amidotransferase
MHSARRIGLLMCGHVDPLSRHLRGDYPELFGALLADHALELVRYDLDGGQFPDSERECDGWICSPSRNSAYDDLAWIADAEELHRRFVALEVPYVGICFGHQLLAQALGGAVAAAAHGWNVGVHEYEITRRQPWMAPGDERIALIASHQDQVVELPRDATCFATAPDETCPIGGMIVGERAWTLQLHPEFVPDLADHLLAGRVELIGADKVARARATLHQPLSRPTVAAWISRFFHTA